ncbi:MAG: GNAT family N-acetyltransferase [Phycisphaerales bacterium]|nr:GNAT family N-acetyltransferase [Phycisphaerales bacterium]
MPGTRSIREASPPERQLAAWLLPRSLGMSQLSQRVEPSVLVAYEAGRFAGAIAVACVTPPSDPPAVPCALHVVPWARQRGLGRDLVASAAGLARLWGVRAISSFEAVEETSDEAQGWSRLGFAPTVAVERFACEAIELRRVLAPLWERLTSRGRVPAGSRLTSLAEAPREDVLKLRAMHLVGGSGSTEAALATDAYDQESSTVAWSRDGRVTGILLCRRMVDGVSHIDSRVVTPGEQRTWVNVGLMHRSLDHGIAMGLRSMTFDAGPEHRDTAILAAKAGGVLVYRTNRYMLAVPPAAG